jgi:hypothetical protein
MGGGGRAKGGGKGERTCSHSSFPETILVFRIHVNNKGLAFGGVKPKSAGKIKRDEDRGRWG